MDQARGMYRRNGKSFAKAMEYHLEHGIVLSSPSWLLMLRAEHLEDGDAWFVEFAAGNLKALAKLVSVHLPFIAFCRERSGTKKVKMYRTDRLLKLAELLT